MEGRLETQHHWTRWDAPVSAAWCHWYRE